MDPLVLAIMKTLVSAGLRLYIGSLMAGGRVAYDEKELGYKVPSWYMAREAGWRRYYAYGTSVQGDEFQSLEHARQAALDQMAQHLRRSHRALIDQHVRFDAASVKQRRLVDLFARGDGMEDFLKTAAKVDRKQLVRVGGEGGGGGDMRAFVRIAMPAKVYQAHQQRVLDDLKTRLTRQKTDDIVAEMDAEVNAFERQKQDADDGGAGEGQPAGTPQAGSSSAFDELDRELKEKARDPSE